MSNSRLSIVLRAYAIDRNKLAKIPKVDPIPAISEDEGVHSYDSQRKAHFECKSFTWWPAVTSVGKRCRTPYQRRSNDACVCMCFVKRMTDAKIHEPSRTFNLLLPNISIFV